MVYDVFFPEHDRVDHIFLEMPYFTAMSEYCRKNPH